MKKRLDPWPSVADLFSGLLVASFSALIIFTAVYQGQIGERERISKEANELVAKVQQALKNALPEGEVQTCGTDTCINVDIEFDLNSDNILPGEVTKIHRACAALKKALSEPRERAELEIFIDGHTDQQQAKRVSDPRERERFNWKLSANRASSVLHELTKCGLKSAASGVKSSDEYRIVAVGHADTSPICKENTEDCFRKNRRTTFRLRADTRVIEERLFPKSIE